MQIKPISAIFLTACLMGLYGQAQAVTKTFELPPDNMQLTSSTLPGYAKAKKSCTECHSAEYMVYQPPSAPRAYWNAMVQRMKVVFKGPIKEADMPDIVDYLTKTYGNEQAAK